MRLDDYEEYYGIQLLDDLHNYFPDILYRQERFISVFDLLNYIRTVMDDRFNIFSSASRRYNTSLASSESTESRPRHTNQPTTPTFIPWNNLYVQTDTQASQPSRDSYLSQPRQQTPPPPPRAAASQQQAQQEQQQQQQQPRSTATATSILAQLLNPSMSNTDILSNLLNSAGARIETYISEIPITIPTNFLEPVVVAPTRQEIAQATRTYTTNRTLDNNCSVCQDRIGANSDVRKIDACQHVFHKRCVDRWFRQSVVCPVCRHDIRELRPLDDSSSDDESEDDTFETNSNNRSTRQQLVD
jgi:hypothetical protein